MLGERDSIRKTKPHLANDSFARKFYTSIQRHPPSLMSPYFRILISAIFAACAPALADPPDEAEDPDVSEIPNDLLDGPGGTDAPPPAEGGQDAATPAPDPADPADPGAPEITPDPDPLLALSPPLATAPPREGLDDRFNFRLAPDGRGDLDSIQDALSAVLPAAMDALVCIEMAGGSGSGVIVSPEGLILSAAHVVMAPGTKLTIRLSDGRELQGETLGILPESDSGMARIVDEGEYPFVPLGDYSAARLGHWVFALGHSGGWDEDRGGVVRLGRIIRIKGDTLQSDCKLIGGDSGGPLFDMHGRLLGINSRVGGNVEQSLHAPVSLMIESDELLRRGRVEGQSQPAFLGAVTENTDSGGVRIKSILEKGAAKRGGIAEGDIITHVWGTEIADREAFAAAIAPLEAGERARLTVLRAESGESEEIWLRFGGRRPFRIMGIGEVE